MPPKSRDEIDVAIICALPLEVDAVDALFDECYDNLQEDDELRNNYNIATVGRIERHHVALVQLPGIGKSVAAGVTSTLLLNFTCIRLVLVVGICGGVPFPFPSKGTDGKRTELLLGDVVIGDTIIEYDFGRRYPAGFERKGGEKCNNDRNLKSFIAKLKTKKLRNKLQEVISSHLSYLHGLESDWAYPGNAQDILFEASYKHIHHHIDTSSPCALCHSHKQSSVCINASIADCDQLGCDGELVERHRLKERRGTAPFIHFGKIASADTVMKSGEDRDKLAHDEGIIALEMEAAAVWDNLDGLPCLVVKGVSDYADSHKSKQWQNYAAATAASCAKALLRLWRPGERRLREQLKDNNILPSIFSVPILRNHRFSGREYQLKQLEELASHTLENRHSYPITAVYGLGGIGKTQLATEFVFRCHKKNPNTSILWVSAASLDAMNTDLISIGVKLKKILIEDEKQKSSHTQRSTLLTLSGIELVNEWMSIPGNKWILVLDNYDDISVNVQQFLPEHLPNRILSGAVIITTRDKRVVGPFASSGFELPQMGFETSIQLFLRLLQGDAELKDYWTHPEYETIQRIVQELHGFPLAIDQAAAFIRENSPSFSEYLRYLKHTNDRELLFRFKQVNPTYPESIMTTWEISFNYLAKKHPRASELLQILGFFHHRISEKLLLNAMVKRQWEFTFLPHSSLSLESKRLPEMHCLAPNAGFRVAVGVLCAFSLVKRGFTEHELIIHPLVHEWIRLRLNGDRAMQARLSLCAALTVYQTFPFELVFDNINGSRSEEAFQGNALWNIGLISPHTEHAALNLQEYADQETSRSECIALFLSLPLIRRAHPGAFHSFMSKRAFSKVVDWLPSYLNRAPSRYHPVFSLIWTINKWNEQEHDSEMWSQRAAAILCVLKATPHKKLNAPPLIMLILVQVFVNFFRFTSSSGRQTIAEISSSDALEIESSLANMTLSGVGKETKETRNCTVQLIHSFRSILDFETDDPAFKNAIILYAEMRCVSYLSITEFWTEANGPLISPLINDPLSTSLTHLSPKDRSRVISVFCMLQWEKPCPKNFEHVRRVYEFGISQATNNATLISQGLRRQAKQHDGWVSVRSYISNSWGRNGSAEFMAVSAAKSTEMDVISPYLERTALNVIESFSDPISCWISAVGPKDTPAAMNLEDRRYAITLFKLWKTCLAELHSMKTLVYNSQIARAGLMRVSLNLNEWDTVLRVVDGIFQLDTNYGKGGLAGAKKLWEARTTTDIEEASSSFDLQTVGDDSWVKSIVIRARELSTHNAVDRYLHSLTQKKGQQANTYQQSNIKVVAESEPFAVYILGQYFAISASDTLLSPFTDEALEAMAIALHKSGRMEASSYLETMSRLEYIMRHPSVLLKCLGRLALLVYLSYFPRPAASMVIKGNAVIKDQRNVVLDDLYLLDGCAEGVTRAEDISRRFKIQRTDTSVSESSSDDSSDQDVDAVI